MKHFIVASLATSALASVIPRDSCKADDCFSAVNPSVCASHQTRTRYSTTQTVFVTVTSAGLQVRDKGRGGGRTKSDRPYSEDRPRTSTITAPSAGFTATFTVSTNRTVPFPTGTGIDDILRKRASKGVDDKTKTKSKTRGSNDDKTSSIALLPTVTATMNVTLPTVTGIDDSGHYGKRAADKGKDDAPGDDRTISKTRSRDDHKKNSITLLPTVTATRNVTLPTVTGIDDSGHVGKRAADKGKDDAPGDDRTSSNRSGYNTSRTISDDRTKNATATTAATGLPIVTGCSVDSKLKSACSCIGITSTTITLPTLTRTRTIIVGATGV